MLGRHFRFVVDNRTGQAFVSGGVIIKYRRWKFDSSGAVVWESSEQSVTIGASLANNSTSASSSIDNSSGLYIGMDVRLEYQGLGASGTGYAAVYLQHSTDGGTTWAGTTSGDVRGVPISAVFWSAASAAQTDEASV